MARQLLVQHRHRVVADWQMNNAPYKLMIYNGHFEPPVAVMEHP